MKVLKFGGTSVGSPERMKAVSKLLIEDGVQKIVVLSAMSGTTNTLVEIADYLKKGNKEAAHNVINKLRAKYMNHVKELHVSPEWLAKTSDFLDDEFMYLHSFAETEFTSTTEKTILAQGEMMSTNMVTNYLLEIGVKVKLIPALDYMKTDADGEPDLNYIQ